MCLWQEYYATGVDFEYCMGRQMNVTLSRRWNAVLNSLSTVPQISTVEEFHFLIN